MWFDDGMARELKIDQARMTELRAMDDTYRTRYGSMGATPWTARDYRMHTTDREAKVRTILSASEYDRWIRTYGSERPAEKLTPVAPDRNMPK